MADETTTRALDDQSFTVELLALMPKMRGQARALARGGREGDDLVQEALARAWANRGRFEAGTNLRAWASLILRNHYLTTRRNAWRASQLDQAAAETTLLAADNPMAILELDEVRRALEALPHQQREALLLIGVGGLSYDEAAALCGCPAGTLKSRVNRAREALRGALDAGGLHRDGASAQSAAGRIIESFQGVVEQAGAES